MFIHGKHYCLPHEKYHSKPDKNAVFSVCIYTKNSALHLSDLRQKYKLLYYNGWIMLVNYFTISASSVCCWFDSNTRSFTLVTHHTRSYLSWFLELYDEKTQSLCRWLNCIITLCQCVCTHTHKHTQLAYHCVGLPNFPLQLS